VTTLRQPDRVEGYEAFFGLAEPPFSLAPDPRFLFASASHSAALAQVVYALERREPLVVVTGEIGTGKTLLCRTVLQQLRRKTFLSVVNDPLLDRDDLLKQLLRDFGVMSREPATVPTPARHELIEALHAFLRSLAPIQAHAVVIIDEAQHLKPEVLEQIRLLSNIDDERGTLLQIILVGQPDLDALLARPELRQLQQRVSRRFRLEPLNRDEVEQYVTHRLTLARGAAVRSQVPGAVELARELAAWQETAEGVEFTPQAIQAVSEISGGLPRVINLLCDRSLEEAYVSRKRTVDGPSVFSAARALGLNAAAHAPTGVDAAAAASLSAAPGMAAPATREAVTDFEAGANDREDFWNRTDSELAPAEHLASHVETGVAPPPKAASIPTSRYVAVGAALLVLAAVLWFGFHALRPAAGVVEAPGVSGPPASSEGSPATAPAGTAAGGNAASGTAPASGSAATLPTPAAPIGAPSGTAPAPGAAPGTPRPATPQPGAVPPAAGAGVTGVATGFDIVVASFRTDERAATVADQVKALGLPMRRRVAAGWQQVISGPFPSQGAAGEAQQRLARAGLSGTQIVPASR
jgi:type II secretory pathway predicted ATPase ExeA